MTPRHCGIRLLGKVNELQTVIETDQKANGSLTIDRGAQAQHDHMGRTEVFRPVSMDPLCPEPSPITEGMSTLPKPEAALRITSWIQETQHAFISENPSLHRHLALMYREIGNQHTEMRKIRLLLEQPREPDTSPAVGPSNDLKPHVSPMDHSVEKVQSDDQTSPAVDIFFDCVSRFSNDISHTTIDGLSAKFSGSPQYPFETSQSFYPEQYSAECFFSQKIITVAIKSLAQEDLVQQYFLWYAETPRRFRRVVISATFDVPEGNSTVFKRSNTGDADTDCKIIPSALQEFFGTLLVDLTLFDSVSHISLPIIEDANGQILTKSHLISVKEEFTEKRVSEQDQILLDIDSMGIAKFTESQIIIKSRISSYRYRVLKDGEEFIERKFPFWKAEHQGEDGFEIFGEELAILNQTRGCSGIVQLAGVVIDDTKRHLKGYLYESPPIVSLGRVFTLANFRSEVIPWRVRELWSSQIIRTLSEVHGRGVILGSLSIKSIGLREDGTILLTTPTSGANLEDCIGAMAPEIRIKQQINPGRQPGKMSFRTDVFQLGHVLWQLAEGTPDITSVYCVRSGCTTFPRFMCDAEHTNPVELPLCGDGVPPYFNEVIRRCRLREPRARPTAHELAKEVPCTGHQIPHQMIDRLTAYAPEIIFFAPKCDECGIWTRELRYHCHICRKGNFDLCPECVQGRGIHCYDEEHQLVKRIFEKGEFVDIS